MGFAKEQWLEEKNRGYSTPKDNYVCSCHFEDVFLKQFIDENSKKGMCYYCSKNEDVILLPTLIEFIYEKITQYYGDIEDQGLPSAKSWIDKDDDENFPYYDSSGLVVPNNRKVYDIEELLFEVGLYIKDSNLYKDILDCFDDTKQYCLIEALYDTKEEELSYKWEQFCSIVKTSRRYTFLTMPEFSINEHSNNRLNNILSELGNAVNNANLISILDPTKCSIFRCRKHNNEEIVNSFTNLASPPSKNASRNRMSPAGISMFYGAFSPKTAFLEISYVNNPEENVSIGLFTLQKPIKVIDLSGLFHLSIFGNSDFNVMSFLKSFVLEISKPFIENEKNIEYVPTQIITEYFRYIFKTKEDENINGLIYQSASNKGDLCCVLFFDNEVCSEYLSLSKYVTLKYEDILIDRISDIDWNNS